MILTSTTQSDVYKIAVSTLPMPERCVKIATSDCNDYIPIYALRKANILIFNNKPVLEYGLLSLSSQSMTVKRSFTYVYNYFKNDITRQTLKVLFKVANVEHIIYVSNGCMYNEQGVLLICLAIKTKYVTENGPTNLSQRLCSSSLLLYMSRQIMQPCYKNLYKNFKDNYINVAENHDIDVVYTNSIEEKLFKNNLVLPKFKTVSESLNYFGNDLSKLLITNMSEITNTTSVAEEIKEIELLPIFSPSNINAYSNAYTDDLPF